MAAARAANRILTPVDLERAGSEPETSCSECGSSQLDPWPSGNEARDERGEPLVFGPCPHCAEQMRDDGLRGMWD